MKRMLIALLAGALLTTTAAAADGSAAPVMLTAAKGTDTTEIVLTVGARSVSFNMIQLAVQYDADKLTPRMVNSAQAAQSAQDMTVYLAPEYRRGSGWMKCEYGTFDTVKGIAEYTIYADPASKGVKNGSDADGYVAAGSSGMEIFALHFTLKDGASFTADSIALASTDYTDYVTVSTKDPKDPHSPVMQTGRAMAQRDFTALGISLSDTAEPEPPKEEGKPDNGGNDGTTGGATGGTGSASGSGSGTNGGQSSGAVQPGQSSELTDMTGHWAQSYAAKLVERGTVTGYPDGSFRPEQSISRGEFCAALCRALELTPEANADAFRDMAGHWAAPYVGAVTKAGLAGGVGDNLFAPDRKITRQEAVKLLVGAFKLPAAEAKPYPDSAQTAAWAADSIARAMAAGLLTGDEGGNINPTGQMSRAEMAAVFCRALGKT